MNIFEKQAILLGRHESWLNYALEGLKGKTALSPIQVAEYIEKRIKETDEEINSNQYEHRNNSQGNTQSTESHTEAVAGEI